MLDESWSDATRRTPDDDWGVEYEDEPLTYPAIQMSILRSPRSRFGGGGGPEPHGTRPALRISTSAARSATLPDMD